MDTTTNPRYILDTNILVHYVRGNELGIRIENNYSLTSSEVAPIISAVTEGELRSLALKLGWGLEKRKRLEEILNHFVVVQLDLPGIYDAYATIDDFSRRSGKVVGKNDVWIAATAKVTGARLLTCDKDFDHLEQSYLVRDYIDPDLSI
jgi:tRNA(fMet)-specific endonuclease VapC